MARLEWADLFSADLAVADPEIAELIAAQGRQNRATVNLVASETYCPAATLTAEASELVNKNAGGYPPRISFNGGETMEGSSGSRSSARRRSSGPSTPISSRSLRQSPTSR